MSTLAVIGVVAFRFFANAFPALTAVATSVSALTWVSTLESLGKALTEILGALTAIYVMFKWIRTKWRARAARRAFAADELTTSYTTDQIHHAACYYIQPDCSNVDPTREAEMRLVVAARQPIFEAVDQCLSNPKYRYFLLLADSGMGKTAFVLNYYARSKLRPFSVESRIAVVPLGQENPDQRINDIPNKSKTVLLLDALDEDTKAIDDYRGRVGELMHMASEFQRVLITCRTQFFRSDDEIPKETGIVRVDVRQAGERRQYEFHKLYLQPLTDQQVEGYLKRRYHGFRTRGVRQRARELIGRVPELACRPMLLTYMPDLLESEHGSINSTYGLYEELVRRWLERDGDWFCGKHEEVLSLSLDLAVDLWGKRKSRGAEHIQLSELETLASRYKLTLKEQKFVSARSLLNRTGDGMFKFSHRSIMEFLVVEARIRALPGSGELDWSDQMESFLREAFTQGVSTVGAQLQGVLLVCGVLVRADLSGANLTRANLIGADLSGAKLTGANLTRAKLTRANLEESNLIRADLNEGDLRNANLREANLGNANLGNANLGNADLGGADLIGADLTGAKLERTDLSRTKGLVTSRTPLL